MLLREYEEKDANEILKWIHNEREFRLWSANRYDHYPIEASDINNNYNKCVKEGLFCPLTLVDEDKVIGHVILRAHPGNENMLRLGFIIIDNSIRGKGYGKKLIQCAFDYGKEKYKINEFSLGVFENNENAFNCYKSMGFEIIGKEENAYKFYDENWTCIEMIKRG